MFTSFDTLRVTVMNEFMLAITTLFTIAQLTCAITIEAYYERVGKFFAKSYLYIYLLVCVASLASHYSSTITIEEAFNAVFNDVWPYILFIFSANIFCMNLASQLSESNPKDTIN